MMLDCGDYECYNLRGENEIQDIVLGPLRSFAFNRSSRSEASQDILYIHGLSTFYSTYFLLAAILSLALPYHHLNPTQMTKMPNMNAALIQLPSLYPPLAS